MHGGSERGGWDPCCSGVLDLVGERESWERKSSSVRTTVYIHPKTELCQPLISCLTLAPSFGMTVGRDHLSPLVGKLLHTCLPQLVLLRSTYRDLVAMVRGQLNNVF